ncbi:helix-turn-helix domain-containing protein [Oceaniglobus trochenteri]|uniref:helix-turn-helix domain-containing protein n=1 Tax=Oceaniglobus trochenteri TaxID=2763260 RepID=UPI001CFFDA7A|nr:helix-turn-helix domain-containing protein [Oceaniglobus trochenteri]
MGDQPPRNLPVRVDDLPASMIDVAEVFGVPVALKLMAHFGGRDMRFPLEPNDDHPILSVLGDKIGRELCFFLSKQDIYIPHGRTTNAKPEVDALARRGLTRTEIARRLGISERHVRRLARRGGVDDRRQLRLFEDEPPRD